MIIPIVFGVVFIVFLMLYFLPGSNISRMPSHGGGDALDAIFSILKAENTFLTRYARYCFNAFLRFDFGLPRSYAIASRVRMTLILTTLGIITALVIGVLAGAVAATHRNRWQDH
ncbi:MAG: hypothetical protein LBH09_08620, partial [Peptococcaceae bacterium]|nr:hypothetical protein [Peptococcaceae bacterium]